MHKKLFSMSEKHANSLFHAHHTKFNLTHKYTRGRGRVHASTLYPHKHVHKTKENKECVPRYCQVTSFGICKSRKQSRQLRQPHHSNILICFSKPVSERKKIFSPCVLPFFSCCVHATVLRLYIYAERPASYYTICQ